MSPAKEGIRDDFSEPHLAVLHHRAENVALLMDVADTCMEKNRQMTAHAGEARVEHALPGSFAVADLFLWGD